MGYQVFKKQSIASDQATYDSANEDGDIWYDSNEELEDSVPEELANCASQLYKDDNGLPSANEARAMETEESQVLTSSGNDTTTVVDGKFVRPKVNFTGVWLLSAI